MQENTPLLVCCSMCFDTHMHTRVHTHTQPCDHHHYGDTGASRHTSNPPRARCGKPRPPSPVPAKTNVFCLSGLAFFRMWLISRFGWLLIKLLKPFTYIFSVNTFSFLSGKYLRVGLLDSVVSE